VAVVSKQTDLYFSSLNKTVARAIDRFKVLSARATSGKELRINTIVAGISFFTNKKIIHPSSKRLVFAQIAPLILLLVALSASCSSDITNVRYFFSNPIM
jgi:uncharacterized membrane protein (DUF373 family)